MGPASLVAHSVATHGLDGGPDDVVCHLVDGTVGVDDDEAPELGLGQGEELPAQGGAERTPLLLQTVLGTAAGGALLGQVGSPSSRMVRSGRRPSVAHRDRSRTSWGPSERAAPW